MTVAHVPLGVGLNGAGWHPAAVTEGRPDTTSAQFWIESVAEAERACLDFVTVDDVPAKAPAPRLDAVLIASRVATRSAHIGLIPSVDVAHADPFHLAQAIGTLDAVSGGRAGVHLRHVPSDVAGYVDSLHAVWDGLLSSTQRDARHVVDTEPGRTTDTLHYIPFVGQRFSVLGPTATPVPPRGRPFVLLTDDLPTPPHAAGRTVTLVDLVVFLDITGSAARARRLVLDDLARRRFEPEAEVFVGSPGQLADRLLDGSAGGYRLLPASTSIDLPLITRRLVPELQMRGALRSSYGAASLAGLLGVADAGEPDATDGLRAAG
jgi:alkanesulfonate monooxygenase SsuD/methylene tetrahydromethanopterin reductase-like flavin-dependent oxidoreductase (luciferase family)